MPHDPAPLVSVITIFLDAKRFFSEAVESVLAQTYPHWELLLVDDGSTDGTSELARGYAARHPDRVRYLAHPGHQHRGMSAARNLGLRHARGALIAFLDADDVWLPQRLEVQVGILAANPRADMVVGTTRLWHSWTGRPEDVAADAIRSVTEPADTLYAPPLLLRRYLNDQALTPATCSILIRREACSRIGGFVDRFTGLYEDQAFFLKAYLELPIYLSASCMDLYRQQPGSYSAEALRTGRYSLHEPSEALRDLFLWLARELVSRRSVDPGVWRPLLRKLWLIRLHKAMHHGSRPVKALLTWWFTSGWTRRLREGRHGR
jgi:glycosyltransferase involved in cell wall biosynthesis